MRVPTAVVLFAFLVGLPASAQYAVRPVLETQPVVRAGTASQDVALWPNSGTPGQSLLIVADAAVGLVTFGLNGREVQVLQANGVAYGVDVREGFSLLGGTAPLVVVAHGNQTLAAYAVDPLSLQLRRVDTGNLSVPSFDPRRVALYRSAATGTLYAFLFNSAGTMQQLELRPNDGGVDGVPVRSFAVGGAVAGAVADDQQGALFVAQQNAGIWRYSAEPDGGDGRASVANAIDPLTAPLGGLSLYSLPSNQGYLLAASAGGDTVVVYRRTPPHTFLGTFSVIQDGGIDDVTGPTSVVASSLALGPSFPNGLVAVHDESNSPMQNDKIVSWRSVASAFSPQLSYSQPGTNPGGSDGGAPDGGSGSDGGTGGGGGGGGGGGTTFPTEPESCGCATASVPGTLLFLVLGLALRRRSRQDG